MKQPTGGRGSIVISIPYPDEISVGLTFGNRATDSCEAIAGGPGGTRRRERPDAGLYVRLFQPHNR